MQGGEGGDDAGGEGGDDASTEPEEGGPSHVQIDWKAEVHSFNYVFNDSTCTCVLLIIRIFLIVSLCFVA